MAKEPSKGDERRIAPRRERSLRADVKVLPEREVEGILEGDGYPDLTSSTLSMTRPRRGMQDVCTSDLSCSGMGIKSSAVLPKGAALAIDLHLPGQRTVVKLLGEVMWSTLVGDEPRAGLRISALDLDSDMRVRNFLGA